MVRCSYLLHDPSLALRESDVATRLVLDELDVNLATLTARLIIVIVVIVAGSSADASTLDAAGLSTLTSIAISGGQGIITGRRRLLIVGISNVGHVVGEYRD